MNKPDAEIMLSDRAIVFSSHTIYTEGVVSRLRQHPHSGNIHFIDAQKDDFIPQVVQLQPSVVIMDVAENGETECCAICDLLNQFDDLTIIRLKVQDKDVQVITSSSYVLENVQDLFDLIWREQR